MHSYLNLENRGWIQKLPCHINQKIASFLQSKDKKWEVQTVRRPAWGQWSWPWSCRTCCWHTPGRWCASVAEKVGGCHQNLPGPTPENVSWLASRKCLQLPENVLEVGANVLLCPGLHWELAQHFWTWIWNGALGSLALSILLLTWMLGSRHYQWHSG